MSTKEKRRLLVNPYGPEIQTEFCCFSSGGTSGLLLRLTVKLHSENFRGSRRGTSGKSGELPGKSGDFPQARGSPTPSHRLAELVSNHRRNLKNNGQGRKTNPNPNFLIHISLGGVGVFHVKGWGPKSSVCPSKPREPNFLADIRKV